MSLTSCTLQKLCACAESIQVWLCSDLAPANRVQVAEGGLRLGKCARISLMHSRRSQLLSHGEGGLRLVAAALGALALQLICDACAVRAQLCQHLLLDQAAQRMSISTNATAGRLRQCLQPAANQRHHGHKGTCMARTQTLCGHVPAMSIWQLDRRPGVWGRARC